MYENQRIDWRAVVQRDVNELAEVVGGIVAKDFMFLQLDDVGVIEELPKILDDIYKAGAAVECMADDITDLLKLSDKKTVLGKAMDLDRHTQEYINYWLNIFVRSLFLARVSGQEVSLGNRPPDVLVVVPLDKVVGEYFPVRLKDVIYGIVEVACKNRVNGLSRILSQAAWGIEDVGGDWHELLARRLEAREIGGNSLFIGQL